MKNAVTKKQTRIFFLSNLVAFALIFLVLGLIVFQILKVSVYREIDDDLKRMSTDTSYIQKRVLQELNGFQIKGGETPVGYNTQTDTVIWDEDGNIVNFSGLGIRQLIFQQLTLDTKNLDKVQSITIKADDTNWRDETFHSITFATKINNENYYVQFLSSTHATQRTVEQFKQILIGCMVIFWLISIGISYYLSTFNMKPILKSWKKQSEFVENASHELRTPLTIIQSKLESLFTHPNHSILEESENIGLALSETRRLSQLTTDLLLLARSDSNITLIHKEAVNIQEFLKEVVEPYQEIAEFEEKTVVLENTEDRLISIDPKRIHQLLVILLDNALKYGGDHAKVEVVSEIVNHSWQIQIKDNGIGIPEEHRKHIFQRFYREDSSRTRETGGYGLGLSIAQWIVESHKGTIKVESNTPQGAIFIVNIPF